MLIASNMFFYAIKIIASRIHPPLPMAASSARQPFPGLPPREELEHWNGPTKARQSPSVGDASDPRGDGPGCSWPGSEPALGEEISRGACQQPCSGRVPLLGVHGSARIGSVSVSFLQETSYAGQTTAALLDPPARSKINTWKVF